MFDSYGQVILAELSDYLKTKKEKNKAVIERNTDIVQQFNTQICGHLCLYVLKSLSLGKTFREILDSLTATGAGIQWGADLIELPTLSKKNSGFRYILMAIDVFSKYGWSVFL